MSAPFEAPVLASLRLAGERVLLRPIAASDAAEAFPLIHRQPEVLRWVPWSGPESVDELERHYATWRRCADGGCDYTFAIVERGSELLRGSIVLRFGGHSGTADVGYWIAAAHHGRGFASEAVQLVCHLAFEHLAAVLLVARTAVGNDASRRVLEKAGFGIDLETTVDGPSGPCREVHMSQSRRAWGKRPRDRAPSIVEVQLEPGAIEPGAPGPGAIEPGAIEPGAIEPGAPGPGAGLNG